MKRNHFTILLATVLAVSVTTLSAQAADEKTTEPDFSVLIEPGLSYVNVRGNAAKFREDTWMKDKFTGGIEAFQLNRKVGKDLNLNIEGRGLFNAHDYKIELELVKPEYWFLRAGYNEYRKYYNGNGGYMVTNNLGPVFLPQNQDLHVDMRDIFIEIGLIRPNLPKITLGYERQEKEGMKSLLEWGTANYTNTVTGTSTNKKIWPSFKAIDEHTDIVRLELEHDIKNIHIGNEFRYEHYQAANTTYDMNSGYLSPYSMGSPVSALNKTNDTYTYKESYKNDLFWNTFHMDSHLNEKVYWSMGYLYSHFNGNDGFDRSRNPDPTFASHYYTTVVDLDSDSHVLNANLMYDPCKTLSFSIGAQAEMSDQEAYQNGYNGNNTVLLTEVDKRSVEENLGVRWTAIPFTTIYAEAKLLQEQTYYNYNLDPAQHGVTLRDTQLNTQGQNFKIGFNSAPLPRMTISGYYRHGNREDDYDGDQEFVISQTFVTDEVAAKLTLRPCSRVSLSFKYQYVLSDISTFGTYTNLSCTSGQYSSSIYTLSATVTPINRLYVTGLVSYQDTYTASQYNGLTSLAPYRGDVYTALVSAGYALDNKTDLTAEYSFSYSDNFNPDVINGGGLDYGLDSHRHGIQVGLKRQLGKNVVANLRYGYFEYVEGSTGGINNYRANLITASCAIRF